MATKTLQIRYSTGWPAAVIHYEAAANRGGCEGWKDAEMKPSKMQGWQEVALQLPEEAERIEFVFKNKEGEGWDNPPQLNRLGRRNYLVDLEKRENEEAFVVVVDGEAVGVYVHPKGENQVLVVTDLDGTLIGHDEYLAKFKKHWTLNHLWRGSKLVYNTGRNLKDFLNAAGAHKLPKPDFAILGVGTEIYTFPGVSSQTHSHFSSLLTPEEQRQHAEDLALRGDSWPGWCPERLCAKFESEWLIKMSKHFNRKQTEELVAREIEGEVYINGNAFHDPLRVSVSIPAVLLSETLRKKNSDFCKKLKTEYKVCVSGGGDWRYLDLLPKEGGKLGATLYVMEQLGFTPEKTLVCGDSGNDIDMFCHPSILGCCVGNAHEVLVAFLKKDKANRLLQQADTKLQQQPNGYSNAIQQPPQKAFSPETAEQKDPEDAEPFFLKDLTPTPNASRFFVFFAFDIANSLKQKVYYFFSSQSGCCREYMLSLPSSSGGILDALRFFKFDSHVNGLS
ncbi:hypothetical protein Efla_002164 [Eimeria flavescens]